jgi:starch-binding outer membrane protein, SusD/RagB family
MSRIAYHTRAVGTVERRLTARFVLAASLAAAVATTACYNFNISDPNGPTLQGLTGSPSMISIDAAVTGVFARARADMPRMIWFVGSMGREGINLSGNNQPDYSEPYYGPLSGSGDGAGEWTTQYATIRDADIVIDNAPKAPDMTAPQQALAIGVAQSQKALMFMQVIETRAQLGAPVDVDLPPTASPAPFVNEDGVYATILATLDSSLANLKTGASASFTFPLPTGYSLVSGSPAAYRQFVWALIAKALCLRATEVTYDVTGGGTAGAAPGYYASALLAIDSSFYVPGSFGATTEPAVSFNYSSNGNDTPNSLSDPITGATFFADTFNITDAQTQTGGALDQRVLNKVVSIESVEASPYSPQILGGIPQIPGWLKFTNYLSDGAVNTSAPIPLIKNEELALLKAEAEIGTGAFAAAVTDLNSIREMTGNLPAYSGPMTQAALITELLYNRRYSLLWEQGTRWIDARRFNLLSTIEPGWNPASFPGFSPPAVPTVMPVPATECEARNLNPVCSPLGT